MTDHTEVTDVCRASATALAERIRSGTLLPTDVADAHLDRIDERDGEINAYVTDTDELAHETAAEADRALESEDGQLLPPGSDVVTGREDIAAYWQEIFDAGIDSARLETTELEDHGDTAIEVEQFTLSVADDQTIDHGTFVVIWKNVDGERRLHRDIWNSSIADEEWKNPCTH